MTVRTLLNSLDSAELSEWAAYFKIDQENFEKKQKGETDMPVEEKVKTALKFQGARVR